VSGKPGRSGGRNRLTPSERLLRGTWRRSRHGDPAAARAELERGGLFSTSGQVLQAASAFGLPVPAEVPREVLAGLGDCGRSLAVDLFGRYDGWTAAKLIVLRELAATADALQQFAQQATVAAEVAPPGRGAVPMMTSEREMIARLRAAAQRNFVMLLKELDLER
jgi:hypothetical protein